MRKFIIFSCQNNALYGSIDNTSAQNGLLVMSGGREPRFGPRRIMARLAQDLAQADIACFRFDRRGIGDSAGQDPGFEGAGPDIAAARTAFRTACPALDKLWLYGNCDAATALLLSLNMHDEPLILSNIWLGNAADARPSARQIRRNLIRKLGNAAEWRRLWTGQIQVRPLWQSLAPLWTRAAPAPIAHRIAAALSSVRRPVHILLSTGDRTALAFLEAWHSDAFRQARGNPHIRITHIATDSHSFTDAAGYAQLHDQLCALLRG
jgi:exosortase A-associated hydrolase 1